MKEKGNQTPRKEHSRSSDLANRRSKDSPAKIISKKASDSSTIAQKSSSEAFLLPIEDGFPEISEDSIDLSSISAISDSNYLSETAENLIMDSDLISPLTSSEAFATSELTPSSKIISTNGNEETDFSKTDSVEVKIMVNLLKQARLQALNSVGMEDKSKKVLEALIEFCINEFYTIPQERDKPLELVNGHAYVGFPCCLLWVVAVLLFAFYLFYFSRASFSYTGPPPT